MFDDVWRYDVDTCAWHPTRRRSTTGTTSTAGARASRERGGGRARRAGKGRGDDPDDVAWPPGRFGHAVVVVPARELDPAAAARLRVADESPCVVIHGGCGARRRC